MILYQGDVGDGSMRVSFLPNPSTPALYRGYISPLGAAITLLHAHTHLSQSWRSVAAERTLISLLCHHISSGHCVWNAHPGAHSLAWCFPRCHPLHEESKQVLVDDASYPILMGVATTSHDTMIVQNTLPGWSLGWSPSGQRKEGVLQGSM